MKTPANAFKQKLLANQRQIGLWLALANPVSAELCAGSGFDWLLIDGEHAPNDLRSILAQLQAIAPYPSCPVVRLPVGDTVLIKQVLELGAQTLLIPMVESAEQATMLVSAMRYPPAGIRGVGSGIARSSRWTLYPNYLNEADSEVCLLTQIESLKGLENLEAIANVEGVDGVFIGPSDLCAAMGYLGNPGAVQVQAAIERAIQRVLACGKAVGMLIADESLAQRYLSLGATFVAVGAETTLLARSSRALAERFKQSQTTSATPSKTVNVY